MSSESKKSSLHYFTSLPTLLLYIHGLDTVHFSASWKDVRQRLLTGLYDHTTYFPICL